MPLDRDVNKESASLTKRLHSLSANHHIQGFKETTSDVESRVKKTGRFTAVNRGNRPNRAGPVPVRSG
jgi:hypothetical protein